MAKLRNTSHEPLCIRNLTCRRCFLLEKSFMALEYIRSNVFSMRRVTFLIELQGLHGTPRTPRTPGTPWDSAGLRGTPWDSVGLRGTPRDSGTPWSPWSPLFPPWLSMRLAAQQTKTGRMCASSRPIIVRGNDLTRAVMWLASIHSHELRWYLN